MKTGFVSDLRSQVEETRARVCLKESASNNHEVTSLPNFSPEAKKYFLLSKHFAHFRILDNGQRAATE